MRRAAVLLSATPVAALAVLAGAGLTPPWAALAAMAACLFAALAVARRRTRDLARVAEALHRAERGDMAGIAAAPRPAQPALRELMAGIERLGRAVAAPPHAADPARAEQGILERFPDPLIVLGADRGVRRANAAARAAFGGDLPAVLRHPVLRAAIDRTMSGGAAQTAGLTLPVPVARDLHASVILLDPPLPEGGRALVVLSDRTRERAVERMRADFVANASHELRTPLASLIGFIDTLRGPAADDPPAQARFLAIMAEQAQRMNRLIDDLLSLSRIELTEHQAPSGAVDLASLVPRIAAGFEPAVAARRIALEVSVAADLPMLSGDPDQIAQVLQNLLDNAVKYGREGGTVRVTAAPAAPGGRWPGRPGVLVSVSDDGPGIAREHIPRLTERFYRADKGRSRAVGGTGLGLAIVKHIVNRHRGQLAIESAEGAGATFAVWLPAGGGRPGEAGA